MSDDAPLRQPPDLDDHARHARRSSRAWWVFAAIALFYLLAEHRAHLFGVLPYLLLAACPLMHFFMHGRHGHRHGGGEHREDGP